MKSSVQIKGHPLHPILVAFPIAFFVGTLILDISGLIMHREDLHNMACYLEGGGIVFALLAAVPGFMDYLLTVPPKSSGKKRAATHGIINVTLVVIFSVALIIRQDENASLLLITMLETTGVILLMISGWLGGTLVFRNQIGLDIRYANAGKWTEQFFEKGTGKIAVAGTEELKVDQMKLLRFRDKRLVLCRSEKGYHVFDDRCTHRGGSLAGGSMICGTVQCPWHGSQFDVQTGSVKAGPAKEKILSYPVSESEGKVFVSLK